MGLLYPSVECGLRHLELQFTQRCQPDFLGVHIEEDSVDFQRAVDKRQHNHMDSELSGVLTWVRRDKNSLSVRYVRATNWIKPITLYFTSLNQTVTRPRSYRRKAGAPIVEQGKERHEEPRTIAPVEEMLRPFGTFPGVHEALAVSPYPFRPLVVTRFILPKLVSLDKGVHLKISPFLADFKLVYGKQQHSIQGRLKEY